MQLFEDSWWDLKIRPGINSKLRSFFTPIGCGLILELNFNIFSSLRFENPKFAVRCFCDKVRIIVPNVCTRVGILDVESKLLGKFCECFYIFSLLKKLRKRSLEFI